MWATREWHLFAIHGTSDWIEALITGVIRVAAWVRMLPWTVSRREKFLTTVKSQTTITGFLGPQSSHMISCAAAETDHKTATSLCIDFSCSRWVHLCFSFSGCIYCGLCVLLCGGKIYFCFGTAVSYILPSLTFKTHFSTQNKELLI